MAKHHPDLIMCRKQPGIGEPFRSCCDLRSYLLQSFLILILWCRVQQSDACARNVSPVHVNSVLSLCIMMSFSSAHSVTRF